MSEYAPVSTMAELALLDDDEILDGYRCGLQGQPEPGSDKSKSFWHGWRNGMIDRGQIPSDHASTNLAQEYVRRLHSH